VNGKLSVPLKTATFLATFPIGPDQALLPYLPFGSQRPPSLQPLRTTGPILASTPFNPEDGGSIFVRYISIQLQEHMVSQSRRSHLIMSTVYPYKYTTLQ
jgi:hypothetical protein